MLHITQVHVQVLGHVYTSFHILRIVCGYLKTFTVLCSVQNRGQIIANMGDVLVDELRICLPVYVNRLRNEITRLTAVRAITVITR